MTNQQLKNIKLGRLLTEFLDLSIDEKGWVFTQWGQKTAEELGSSVYELLKVNKLIRKDPLPKPKNTFALTEGK